MAYDNIKLYKIDSTLPQAVLMQTKKFQPYLKIELNKNYNYFFTIINGFTLMRS